MNDRQIAALFMAELLPRVRASEGLSAVKMARNFQTRQHGAESSPYVYFFKVGDHKHGHPARLDVWNEQAGRFDHTERQVYETTFQFSAWIPQPDNDPAALSESDVLNVVSCIIQSDAVLAAFEAQGVGVLRVTEVRNPQIVDERDQFEAVPTFDVVLTHNRILVSTLPAVATIEANVGRV